VKLIEMKHNRTNERTNQIQGQPLVISPFTFQEFTSFIIVYFIPITFNILWYIGFLLCLLLIFLALGFCPFGDIEFLLLDIYSIWLIHHLTWGFYQQLLGFLGFLHHSSAASQVKCQGNHMVFQVCSYLIWCNVLKLCLCCVLLVQLNYNGMTNEKRNESMNLIETKAQNKAHNSPRTTFHSLQNPHSVVCFV